VRTAAAPEPTGPWAAQLGIGSSEAQAQSLARSLAEKYGLSEQPFVRSAEVSGRTVYRIRVGASSQSEASAVCSRVKAAGGQCFVARN